MRALRMGVATTITALSFLLFLTHLWTSHDRDSETAAAVQAFIKKGGKIRQIRPQIGPLDFDDQIRNDTLGVSMPFH